MESQCRTDLANCPKPEIEQCCHWGMTFKTFNTFKIVKLKLMVVSFHFLFLYSNDSSPEYDENVLCVFYVLCLNATDSEA